MGIEIVDGNIFTTSHQTIVNTVNCVGVMGAGIALECRLRYPAMFSKYCEICRVGQLRPGVLWLYKGGSDSSDIDDRWVLNFPTKDNWKYPSKFEYLRWGLDKFLSTYREKGIESIAFPILGGLNGGLDPEKVIDLMTEKLSGCAIPITIYRYSPTASDDLYSRFKEKLLRENPDKVLKQVRIRKSIYTKVLEVLTHDNVCQMNQLAKEPGIGIKTMEMLFKYVCLSSSEGSLTQGEFEL